MGWYCWLCTRVEEGRVACYIYVTSRRSTTNEIHQGMLCVGLGPSFSVALFCRRGQDRIRGSSWENSPSPITGQPGVVPGGAGSTRQDRKLPGRRCTGARYGVGGVEFR
ncbi:hypothetical protein KQX54_005751 [Cotesia glomerata]|uniref:Uncharacterized protein n=1 Tax=Cotesia glomerata TaxID=32391 RepID=A0AAV7J090_COTGL|nr:hypothetical protein KQX54_005751 [Cotesia glomerata]